MARYAKNGLEFMNIGDYLCNKYKIDLVQEEFGEAAVYRTLLILSEIYTKGGFWIEWNKTSANDFARTVLGKSQSVKEIKKLVAFLLEIDFLTYVREERSGFLTSPEIVQTWGRKIARAKRKINLDLIPGALKNDPVISRELAKFVPGFPVAPVSGTLQTAMETEQESHTDDSNRIGDDLDEA